MQRVSTTVLAVVGMHARRWAEQLGRAANVRAALPDPADPPMERAAEALRAAAATKTPFVVSDADPLMVVSRAWERFFDGQAPAGELEVAVADAIGRWRAGDVELPD